MGQKLGNILTPNIKLAKKLFGDAYNIVSDENDLDETLPTVKVDEEGCAEYVNNSVYESIFGKLSNEQKKVWTEKDALREASRRAQKVLLSDTRKSSVYDGLWSRVSLELSEKLLAIKALADNNDWFKEFYKYLDINFFKDRYTDALVFVAEFMIDAIKKRNVCNMAMVRHYVSNMKESQFSPSCDADEYKKEILRAFDELSDVPKEIEMHSLNTLLLLCLQRNIMRRTLSDPQVFLARGIDVNNEAELEQLLNDENLMMDIIYGFPEEREFVSKLITSISKIGDPRDI